VPVIKLEFENTYPMTGVTKVDITMTDFSSDPYFSKGYETITFVLQQCEAFPIVKEVILVVKQILANHSLNEPYTGGVSSLSLFVMVFSYFNSYGRKEKRTEELLFSFLNFYGNGFNSEETEVRFIEIRS
jgi:DNA polymerase sigma